MFDYTIVLITGARKGVGRYLTEYYVSKRPVVVGCSREPSDFHAENYEHFCLDVADERAVQEMVSAIRRTYDCPDILVNNAGMASMNHVLLTSSVETRKPEFMEIAEVEASFRLDEKDSLEIVRRDCTCHVSRCVS